MHRLWTGYVFFSYLREMSVLEWDDVEDQNTAALGGGGGAAGKAKAFFVGLLKLDFHFSLNSSLCSFPFPKQGLVIEPRFFFENWFRFSPEVFCTSHFLTEHRDFWKLRKICGYEDLWKLHLYPQAVQTCTVEFPKYFPVATCGRLILECRRGLVPCVG